MSTVQQASRTRSLGASLLDQVLAETLDPAYAQAAARAAAGGPAPRTHRGWRALAAVVMVLAGLLAALTYNEASAASPDREERRAALIADIGRESGVTDDLVATLAQLQTDVGTSRAQTLSATTEGQRALDRLAAEEAGAASVPVRGPGLTVTLGNALPSADDDPVAGSSTQDDDVDQVLDRDLQLLVNSLWAAGAEAISVDGQRLGPTTTIRQAGGAILVDLRPVTSPYEVQAIGNQDDLYNGFITSPEARYLVSLQQTYDWVFTFGRTADLSLPGAGSVELRSAQPVPATTGGGASTGTPGAGTTADDGD